MKILLVIGVLLLYSFSLRFVSKVIVQVGLIKDGDSYRIKYISKTINIVLTLLCLTLLTLLLGIEYSQLAVFLSSLFAVIGVALFAQWSILSNITASLIIFFAFPYRVGDQIRIVDKDENIAGIVDEITLFHVIIRRDDELVTYPNSLILQKPVVKMADGAPSPNSRIVLLNQAEQEKL